MHTQLSDGLYSKVTVYNDIDAHHCIRNMTDYVKGKKKRRKRRDSWITFVYIDKVK